MTNQMIEVKTEELEGVALDWAVLFALYGDGPDWKVIDGKLLIVSLVNVRVGMDGVGEQEVAEPFSPSTDWSQGGPLIEKFHVAIDWNTSNDDDPDFDSTPWIGVCSNGPFCYAASPLIAACRAIVASKLGETVSIPRDLLP